MASANTTDGSNNSSEPHSFKAQLDRAAIEAKNPDAFKPQPTIVDKVTQAVPVVGRLLGKDPNAAEQEDPSSSRPDPDVPPVRPDHDANIEEFVRDQHRSKKPDGKLVV